MSALPEGIVALLMTDVEGSSRRWNEAHDEMDAAVTALDRDLTDIVRRHRGHVIKARGEGDSHFAVFTFATDAVVAAVAVQRREDRRLDVRACVVIGEASPRDGDYVGDVVNHGARVRSVAHGGQVVTTGAVVDVVRGHLPDDLGARALGRHRVRDVPDPVDLFQLTGPGLRSTFPPPRTAAYTATALMTVVVVDEPGGSRHFDSTHDGMVAWQRELIRCLRTLSDAHDGRYLKLLGDGCIVGFEDPRRARAFADAAQLQAPWCIGIAVGLVEVIEGELVGHPVFEAYRLMRAAGSGETCCTPALAEVCAHV